MAGPPRSALLLIDVQNDFCAGGALEVRGGDRVVEPLNRMIQRAEVRGEPVYATRDWHPADTRHFQAFGGQWPVHCVAGTHGAAFHPALRLPPSAIIVTTGDTRDAEGYSAFEGHTPAGRALLDDLRDRGVRRLYVGGLATDFCVRHSVLDALANGFRVTLLADAVAGVNLQPQDSERALEEMKRAGARLRTTENVYRRSGLRTEDRGARERKCSP
jgi:nicotinamidase/pyrazinamidase